MHQLSRTSLAWLAVLALPVTALPVTANAREAAAPPTPAVPSAFVATGAATPATAPAAVWWEALGDPVLNQLITQALANSPDLAAASARISAARATLGGARRSGTPRVNAIGAEALIDVPNALLTPGTAGRNSQSMTNTVLDASWELDLYGTNRARVASASASAAAAEAAKADAAVALSAEVARVYTRLVALHHEARLRTEASFVDATALVLTAERVKAGTTDAATVDAAKTRLAASQASESDAAAEEAVLVAQLTTLLGLPQGSWITLKSFDNTSMPWSAQQQAAQLAEHGLPLPPDSVAIGDPAGLIARRPDVRRAAAQWVAAQADIKIQHDAGLPQISFLGVLGTGGKSIDKVVAPSSLIALAVPQLSWSLLDGGRQRAALAGKRAAGEEAAARYRGAVIDALGDAEAALRRFGAARIDYAKALERQAAAIHAQDLAKARAEAGVIARIDLAPAAHERIDAEIAVAETSAALTSAYVAVAKALGLGWTAAAPGPAGG